jgi:hypothetical protein
MGHNCGHEDSLTRSQDSFYAWICSETAGSNNGDRIEIGTSTNPSFSDLQYDRESPERYLASHIEH